MTLRNLLIVGAVLAIAVPAAAHGTTKRSSSVNVPRLANLYQIDQLEVKWHKATSKKDLALMMSIMAPSVRLQSNGATYVGKAAVQKVFARAAPFQPENRWVSDTPAYKIRATVNGNRGTLYFECHYIDVDTGKVVAAVGADQEVRKINDRWLITNLTAATVTLKP